MISAPFTAFVTVLPSRAFDALQALDSCGATALELLDEGSPHVACAALDGADEVEVHSRVLLALASCGLGEVPVRVTPTAILDWGSTWAARLRPLSLGPLTVCVDDVEGPAVEGVLRVSTRGAFGSGFHATTALCMERLPSLVRPDVDVLDVGTGTGILALCAVGLGARSAVATDNDPRARQVAWENAQRNGLAHALTVRAEDPDALGQQFGLVFANILASPLIALAPRIVRALGPAGRLLLSGVRTSEVREVRRAYTWLGLRDSGEEARDDWVRLELTTPW